MFKRLKTNIALIVLFTLICGLGNVAYAAAWTGAVASSFSYGSGTLSDPYQICDESEFAYFLSNIESGITYDGMYFKLTADIDVSAGNLTLPTGTFNGVFNGNGYKIISSVPFMNIIGENATVKLLTYQTIGEVGGELFCGKNNGTIDSCSVYGNAKFYTSRSALFCAYNNGSILNSSIVGSIYGRGDDCSVYLSEVAYSNTGLIENVYSAVALSGYASGRYNDFNKRPFVYENSGTLKNVYYDKTVTDLSTNSAAPMTTEELKSSSFIETMNVNNPSLLSDWVADTTGINDGYPILTANEKIEETVAVSYDSSELFTYHTTSFTTKFNLSSERDCTIYYTLDGTNPKTSSTRKTYTKNTDITVSGDTTIKSVAYYGGVYGRICTQKAVRILGGGTEENPYEIADKNDLIVISLEPDAYYKMTEDVIFDDSDYAADGILPKGWVSIPEFSGTLDGGGHKIENLQGHDSGFITQNTGTLKYTRFINHQIASSGSIVRINSGTLEHCYIDLNISSNTTGRIIAGDIGGVTHSNSGTIKYCTVTGDLYVQGPSYRYCWVYVGGITYSGSVQNCYSDLNIDIYSPSITEYVYAGGITSTGYAYNCASETKFRFNVRLDYDIYCSSCSPAYSATNYGCYGSMSSYGKPSNEMMYNSANYVNGQQYLESNFPKLDFSDTWMITTDGPRPQGIMNADGKCLYKQSYTAPTCNTDGETICTDQYGNVTAEILAKYPHTLVDGVCTNAGCDYKGIYKIDLKYNDEIITSEFEAYKNRDYQFTAETEPSDALDKTITWSSSDANVATVSEDGLVSAVGEGSCLITATASNAKAEIKLNVTEIPYLNKIKVSDGTAVVGEENIVKTISLATDKDVNFLYCVLTYPDSLKLKNIEAVDFEYVEKESEYTQNGYTALIVSGLYSDTEYIPKDHTFIPFKLTFDVSKSTACGTVQVSISNESQLIGNNSYYFDEQIPGDLEITPKLVEVIEISGSDTISDAAEYTATVLPDYTTNPSVVWSVDNTDIATVDENGVVTPVTSGTFTLTATAADGSGTKAEKTITVMKYVESIVIFGEESITESAVYTAEVLPSYATNKAIEWSIDDESIAAIDKNGKLTPVKSGIVTIKAAATDGSDVSATKQVNIIKLAEEIEIIGETEISSPSQYSASVLPDYTTDKSVTWSIDNESIATIDEFGIVTPITSGTVVITAAAADGSGVETTKTIEIVKYAESIEIVGDSEITEETRYSVVILPDYTTNKNAQWEISDESIATVDENGVVTPLKNGKVVLTATAEDASGISATQSIVVTVSVRANSITSNIGDWNRNFDPDITEYIVYVPGDATSILLTASFENATAKINGKITGNHIPKSITLDGETTSIELLLTPLSGNPLKSNTYTIIVVKRFKPSTGGSSGSSSSGGGGCNIGTQTTISADGKTFDVEAVNLEKGNIIIIALYENNKCVETKYAVYNDGNVTFATDKNYTDVKVMVWESLGNIAPVCDVEVVK